MTDFNTLKSENGLILAIVQDKSSREVLMCAYMNREALEKTVETGIAHFWSRSRQQLWKKGETSGHVQKVKEIRIDCDMDSLLLLVEQIGGACHMGYRSCFYRNLEGKIIGEKVFEPEDVY
jgi:phosphoribosyl-AMP cyclohydrolase